MLKAAEREPREAADLGRDGAGELIAGVCCEAAHLGRDGAAELIVVEVQNKPRGGRSR